MDYYDQLTAASSFIRAKLPATPDVAVVLGSGLGDFAGRLTDPVSIPYAGIPNWPASTVVGHEGRLVVGRLSGQTVAALSGRAHFYEGYPLRIVVFAVRVMALAGVKQVILTNAAGGINTGFAKGALMVIDDHINLLGTNPLFGPNDDRLGVRFPDMTEVYARRLRSVADQAAREAGVPIEHGVYVAVHGPSYETPAEIRSLRTIGADAVGMSTVPEAIAGRHMGLEVLGLSCITNMAAGVLPTPLDHREVMETAQRVREQFIALLAGIIGKI